MKNIDDLEAAMRGSGERGMALHFGPSVSKNHASEFFANLGPGTRQVYANSLREALSDLFSCEPVSEQADDMDDLL